MNPSLKLYGRQVASVASKVLPIGGQFARDKRKFEKQRAEFYLDLAENMISQPTVNITVHIERLVERYPHEAKGRLASRWLANYKLEGTFADSIRDSVPAEDYAPIMVAEKAGDLAEGLKELSTVLAALDATKDALSALWFATIFAFVTLQIFIAFYAFRVLPEVEAAKPAHMTFYDVGLATGLLHTLGVVVRTFWPLWFIAIAAFVGVLTWSLTNYVGPHREWLDKHVLHYKLYAEFQAISFFVALAAVTRRINNRVMSVPNALRLMQPTATVWLGHHIRKILANYEDRPHAKGENFRVGMVGKDVEFRMMDIADYADVSTMLKTVAMSEIAKAPKLMERRAARIQLAARIVMVSVVLGMQFAFYVMGFELQDALGASMY